jgi:aromatic ring-opening dioxygenase LigB subunit
MDETDKQTIKEAWKQIMDVMHNNPKIIIITPKNYSDIIGKITELERSIKRISESRDMWRKRYETNKNRTKDISL